MDTPPPSELSERELEILRLVATGASNKEIALQLFISSNTVKVHLRNIFSKVGAASRTEAAMYAVRIGLIEGVPGLPPADGSHPTPTTPESLAPPAAEPLIAPRRWPLWVTLILIGFILTSSLLILTQGRNIIARLDETPATPSSTEIPRWHELSALPTPRGSLTLVAYENQLFAIAGETIQGITGECNQYNIHNNTWTTLTSKLIPVADVNATVINGRIFVPGGRIGSDPSQLTDQLEIYDPAQDTWTYGAPLPFPLSGYSAIAFEGHLYIFGGWDGKSYRSDVLMYDPTLDAWQERSRMPTSRAFSSAAEAGGVIYVIGGYNGINALDTNEVYSPSRENNNNNPWEYAQALPQGRYDMGITSVADLIYLIGGIGNEGETLQPLEYSPSTQSWQSFNMPIPESWSGMGLISSGPNLYMGGGQVQGLFTGLFLSYQAIYTVILPIVQ
jgi:DNA-binding CsgD family transcriptional regulator/N-acetylneuraminic acid mutarotase